MTRSSFKLLILFPFILFQPSKTKEYGCYEGESCILSSHENNYTPQDSLYCTSSVTSCNIYCLSPNSCESIIIYSSAQSTNIICNETSSCYNTTIRIGDTSIYPSIFKSKHFSNTNPISSNIHCEGDQSCSSLKYIFYGKDEDQCTISSINKNAFYDGYFDCNYIQTDTDGYKNGCNLFCDNQYENECLDAILDCNEAANIYCKCNGDGCYNKLQEVVIYYDNSTTTTNPSIPTRSAIQQHAHQISFFEKDAFKIIIISIIIVVVLLGCALIICCWKFEAFYDFYERKKTRKLHLRRSIASKSKSERTNIKCGHDRIGEGAASEDDENKTKSSHINQHSHTVSQSQSGGDVEQTTTTTMMTTETVQNIQKENNNDDDDDDDDDDNDDDDNDDHERRITNSEPIHTHTHTTSALLDTSRERMPSSWYRYQEEKKQQSMDMTNTTNTISPMTMTVSHNTTSTQFRSSTISPQTVTDTMNTMNTATTTTTTTTMRTGTGIKSSILQSPSNDVLSPLSSAKPSKNKRRKNHSINSIDENKENYNPNVSIKKPQKQNKKRKKSGHIKRNNSNQSKDSHHKHQKIKDKKHSIEHHGKYKKIEINIKPKSNATKAKRKSIRKHKGMRTSNTIEQHDGDDTDSMTSSFDDDTDSSDDSDTDTETSSYTGSDTTSSSDDDEEEEEDDDDDYDDDDSTKDGDNDPQTQQTVNVDDMLINMVMLMQNKKTPITENKIVPTSSPKTQPIPQYIDV